MKNALKPKGRSNLPEKSLEELTEELRIFMLEQISTDCGIPFEYLMGNCAQAIVDKEQFELLEEKNKHDKSSIWAAINVPGYDIYK